MNVEASRQKEEFFHVWFLPPGMSRDEAHRYFLARVKPQAYTFEKFRYNPETGKTATL